jgi:large subunit ribosomal protein L6
VSRVGKNKIIVPVGITCLLQKNVLLFEKASPSGAVSESYIVPDCLSVEKTESVIGFLPLDSSRQTRSLWGTVQKNVSNIVVGLSTGFSVSLELVGVGYKASVDVAASKITLLLGYSHPVVYDIPVGVSITCPKPTSIIIRGHRKKQVGDVAAALRRFRPPEPYKGKGVIRVGDFVFMKERRKR